MQLTVIDHCRQILKRNPAPMQAIDIAMEAVDYDDNILRAYGTVNNLSRYMHRSMYRLPAEFIFTDGKWDLV